MEALVGLLDASGRGVDPVGVAGELPGDVGQLDPQRVEPLGEGDEGAVGAGGAGKGLPGDVEQGSGGGAVVVADQGERGLPGGAAELLGVAEPFDLGAQRVVLPRLGVGLLEPLQRLGEDGAAALPLGEQGVELGEALGEDGALAPDRAVPLEQRLDLGGAEAVQGLALGVVVAQTLLVGLAVHGDRGAHQPGEGPDRDGDPADLGAGAAVAGQTAHHEHLAVLLLGAEIVHRVRELPVPGERESAVDGAGAAGAASVQATAQQHGQAGDDHGLAGSGLAGQGGESRPELEQGIVDHADVADAQGGQHGGAFSGCAGRGPASPRRAAGTSRPVDRRTGSGRGGPGAPSARRAAPRSASRPRCPPRGARRG